jgi:drug/metabolite transporter (DMT)-like permease
LLTTATSRHCSRSHDDFLHRDPEVEIGAVIAVGFGIGAIISLIAGAANHFSEVTDMDWLYLTLMGAIEYPIALTCMGSATKYVPASEVGIYLLLGEFIHVLSRKANVVRLSVSTQTAWMY